jgi:hypothetical protein
MLRSTSWRMFEPVRGLLRLLRRQRRPAPYKRRF